MEDYRSQALRMLVRWGQEMEHLEVRGSHPVQAIFDVQHKRGKREKAIKVPTVHATETRRGGLQRIPIHELSPESKRTDRILRFIRDEDEKAYRALELMAMGIKHADASTRLRLGEHDHRASVRVGVSLMAAILRLKAI